jgi:hypothetical protein
MKRPMRRAMKRPMRKAMKRTMRRAMKRTMRRKNMLVSICRHAPCGDAGVDCWS